MTLIEDLSEVLAARLPELEWKLGGVDETLSSKLLPPGLFSSQINMSTQKCVAEVRSSLLALKDERSEQSMQYLAKRINRQLNVLVRICKLHAKELPQHVSSAFDMQAMSTRRQCLSKLENKIESLKVQREALRVRLKQERGLRCCPKFIVVLQAEIGMLERKLSLTQEHLERLSA